METVTGGSMWTPENEGSLAPPERNIRLNIYDLGIDNSYQPPISESRVRRIADRFSWNLFQEITVNERINNGGRYIIDGQHRVQAARMVRPNMPSGNVMFDTVPATLFKGLSPAEEAQLFIDINTKRRASMTTISLYQANLTAGDPDTLEIDEIVRSRDQRVGKNGSLVKTAIGSVNALYWIHSMGTDAFGRGMLGQVLDFIKETYPDEPYRWASPLPATIAQFMHRYPMADIQRLSRNMRGTLPKLLIARINNVFSDQDINLLSNGSDGYYVNRNAKISNTPASKTAAGVLVLKRLYHQNLREGSKTRLD